MPKSYNNNKHRKEIESNLDDSDQVNGLFASAVSTVDKNLNMP